MRPEGEALLGKFEGLAKATTFLLWGCYFGQQVSLLTAIVGTAPYALLFTAHVSRLVHRMLRRAS